MSDKFCISHFPDLPFFSTQNEQTAPTSKGVLGHRGRLLHTPHYNIA